MTYAAIGLVVFVTLLVVVPITRSIEVTKRKILQVFLEVPAVVIRSLRFTSERQLAAFTAELSDGEDESLEEEVVCIFNLCERQSMTLDSTQLMIWTSTVTSKKRWIGQHWP